MTEINKAALDAMTDQELADAVQAAIARAIRLSTAAQHRACGYAATIPAAQPVVAPLADCVGHLWQAHADATTAANAMPGITPAFGGDK